MMVDKLLGFSTLAPSQNDAPWLQHILNILLKNGAGIPTILCHIEDAITTGYNPHGYNQNKIDLAVLIYRVGGGNLLTALNQCLCLLAVRTIQQNTLSVKITPTIGIITPKTIVQNIINIVLKPRLHAGQNAL